MRIVKLIYIHLKASTCPPLATPTLGTFPSNCLNGKMYPGESCAIICPPGTKSIGAAVTQCLPTRRWSTTNLDCIVVKVTQPKVHVQSPEIKSNIQHRLEIKPKTRIQGGETYSRGHIDLNAAAASRSIHPQNILQPYIKCPRDTTIVLPRNKKTVYVKLEQPKSNVAWATHIDANPAWAKNLQAHLAAGVHTLVFRARSPSSASISDVCQTVITVKSTDALAVTSVPQVLYCPPTINVQLQSNEVNREITWKEPQFRSNSPLKQIFKSNLPGTRFSVGQHKITYIATDIRNQNATCKFTLSVRPSS